MLSLSHHDRGMVAGEVALKKVLYLGVGYIGLSFSYVMALFHGSGGTKELDSSSDPSGTNMSSSHLCRPLGLVQTRLQNHKAKPCFLMPTPPSPRPIICVGGGEGRRKGDGVRM